MWAVSLAQVGTCPQLIFPFKTWFFEIYWIFNGRNHLKINISQSYQINSIKSCSSRSSQEHQKHIPIPSKFSATIQFNFQWKKFNIQKLLHRKSKGHRTKQMPTSSRAFQDTKNMIWIIPVQCILYLQNKTNYIPSWIDFFKRTKVFLPWIENPFARRTVLQVATLPNKKGKKQDTGYWCVLFIINAMKCSHFPPPNTISLPSRSQVRLSQIRPGLHHQHPQAPSLSPCSTSHQVRKFLGGTPTN